jgi:flavin-dependent dehydrogenase
MAPPTDYDHDVVIAGGGPGGAALAARLHQLDPALAARTLVLDRARFPRAKPCGGGLTGHAADAMRALGLTLDVARAPAPSATVRYGAFTRAVRLPRPVDIVRREELDASLLAQARARGATVREGEALEDFRVEDGGVTVLTSAGRLRARVLVGADGAASVVRKRLHAREATPIRLFRAEIPAPPSWRGRDDMVYDFSLMADGLRGYLWVFPSPDERLNVGLMHHPRVKLSGAALVELLARGLRGHGIELPRPATRGWPAWSYAPGRAVSAPHVLTLGDAAGIDALTGEGIAVAMEHAIVAGDAIAAALLRSDFSFAGYRRALRRATVGRELALDRWLARFLYAGRRWRSWLSLVLYDRDVLELYAARVAGGLVLADQKLRLVRALAAHVLRWPARRRALGAAAHASAASTTS